MPPIQHQRESSLRIAQSVVPFVKRDPPAETAFQVLPPPRTVGGRFDPQHRSSLVFVMAQTRSSFAEKAERNVFVTMGGVPLSPPSTSPPSPSPPSLASGVVMTAP